MERFAKASQEPVRKPQERDTYPELLNLLRSYFHQDYDLFGEDPEQIIIGFKNENSVGVLRSLASDANRYLNAHRNEDENQFTETFEQVFAPDIEFTDWKGGTVREFLKYIANLFSEK